MSKGRKKVAIYTTKYLEKKVSLISTADVRYDGKMSVIDVSQQCMTLKQVQCMGTEGRRSGEQAIASSDCVYEFIIYRAENIAKLWLYEDNGSRRDITNEILQNPFNESVKRLEKEHPLCSILQNPLNESVERLEKEKQELKQKVNRLQKELKREKQQKKHLGICCVQ
eukprot:441823_1